MPSVIEYRIPFPSTVDQYRVGMMWMILRASKEELRRSSGQGGVEFLHHRQFSAAENEHGFGEGIYTEKVFHIQMFLPRFLRPFVPSSKAKLVEKSWAAYPDRCITFYSAPFIGEHPFLSIESRYLPDRGDTHNALHLGEADLAKREVAHLDIASEDRLRMGKGADVRGHVSAHTHRELQPGVWARADEPCMCIYKVCRMDIAAPPVETWTGRFLQNSFIRYHRQMFLLMDQWIGLGLRDIPGALPAARKERVGALVATELAADVTMSGPELFDHADRSNPFA